MRHYMVHVRYAARHRPRRVSDVWWLTLDVQIRSLSAPAVAFGDHVNGPRRTITRRFPIKWLNWNSRIVYFFREGQFGRY